jgi:hypothetical protein
MFRASAAGVRFRELSLGQTILDARDEAGKGIALRDGHPAAASDSDPGTHPGTLKVGVWQHVAVIVDGQCYLRTSEVVGNYQGGY